MKSKVNYRICGLFATSQPIDNLKVGDLRLIVEHFNSKLDERCF